MFTKAVSRHGLRLDDGDMSLVEGFDILALRRGNGQHAPFARSKVAPKRSVALARLLCNPSADEVVDHINGDPWDNRRTNLRVCKQRMNVRNARISRGHSVGFKGVSRNGSKFQAAICCDGERRYLGTFPTAGLAAAAYDAAARELFGDYCAVNFPQAGERNALTGGWAHG